MTQRFRTAKGGQIDRSAPVEFRYDGRRYEGYRGDTLASALLANGMRLMGRSFKLHRPRGVFTAGVEEPNALAELRIGARREPNTRMTGIELHEGLVAASQNRFPSLRFDLMSLVGLAAPLLSAGFYYKTFMWPASFWEKVYEPRIRAAAGLGRAAREPDPDFYEALHAHCDVLVVGSGAAGLAAAHAAAAAGQRVMLCEQDFQFGGGLLAEPEQDAWREAMLAALAATPEVVLLPRTTVFGYYDGNVLGAVERVADHLAVPPPHTPRQRRWTIHAGQVVLATGAHERLIAFPGNDRPGVMLAGAVHSYVQRFGVRPGQRMALFANNDEAYRALFAAQDAGIAVAGVVDPRADSAGLAAARARGLAVWAGSEVCGTLGAASLRGVRLRRRGGSGTDKRLTCDLLLISGGYSPAVHLASQSGTKLAWDVRLAAHVPAEAMQNQVSVGAAAGVFGIAAAAGSGAQGTEMEHPAADDPNPEVMPIWEVRGGGKAFVDLQDDVTARDIRLAHREGFGHIEHAKRYTTHMMGTDQGKTGGLVGAAVLAEARGVAVEAVGLPSFRPFTSPVAWGALAGAQVGPDYAPVRLPPLHDWHQRHAAEFVEAGHWLRPSYYPGASDGDVWDSVLREARAVRRDVGICDVSTLGKIDVQGADAAAFLDLIYVNTISTLKPGRARYGLMLREDGFAFDDGTVSRLAPEHFLLSTTTANAARVLAHLEFHAQTAFSGLDVTIVSVTDQWAAMSVAGPKARAALAPLISGLDLSNEAFPFMAVGDAILQDGSRGGRPVRVFRISFSGELAYEIATPAGHAEAVWKAILRAGAGAGIIPYGTEALGLLRIEKGHVAGPELNGQTTAGDLGLARLCKKRGDYIGRALSQRPALVDPARPSLVGLRPLSRNDVLRPGAQLVAGAGSESLGWVSSATRGVSVEGAIGLGFLRGGVVPDVVSCAGETLYAAYPLLEERVAVEVVSPQFIDPENARVRA
jgi:sarcosine oxidase subunit alpha